MSPFELISHETKFTVAIQMVVMDALEKGLTTANVVDYMKTAAFEQQVRGYISLMK